MAEEAHYCYGGRRQIPTYVETAPQPVPTVRWDYVTPGRVTAEHQLHLLDRDLQRLAGEMKQLQQDKRVYSSPPPVFTSTSGDVLTKLGGNGAGAHAETWREKENFHLENPVIKDHDGRHQFRLEFDLRQFKPEEISVTVEGRQLTVQAKHEETEEGKKARREYYRQCNIPENVDPMTLVSRQSQSGILSIFAPLPVENNEQTIPVVKK